MKKHDVSKYAVGESDRGPPWRLAHRAGQRPTLSKIEFFDAPAERHILGAQLPKFLDSFLNQVEEKALSSATGGPNEYT